jgi:FKBP-type peptidyl-prolyl cis-trans isomerase 2
LFKVTAVAEDSITVDGNHPLAGMALSFDIELVAIG